MAENRGQLTVHQKLKRLASNLWWSWHPEVVEIFRLLAPSEFTSNNNNPLVLLEKFDAKQIEERANQEVLHSRIHHAYRRWVEYMKSATTWGATHTAILGQGPVAYFSAEFGLHESLAIYSGGLGVLAGDHLKSASDLGIPLVGIGLFYREGYFEQTIDASGRQKEEYPPQVLATLPVREAVGEDDKPVKVAVETETGTIYARVLMVNVGRVELYLLDTSVPENDDDDKRLTARLYGGDQRTRIRQELLLGVGGVRALRAVGIQPNVIHMNEGHSAFAPLELIRQRMDADGQTFTNALRDVAAGAVFTTHTPVPAGHDRFPSELLLEHLRPLASALGLNDEGILGLGRVDPQNSSETFCMTVLALKICRIANGVSSLHGVVSRRMWTSLWPYRSEEEVPIGHITNGVHVPTWLAAQMQVLYDRVLPENWYERTGEAEIWKGFEHVTPGELWETHQSLKNRLINYARRTAAQQAERRGASSAVIEQLHEALDPRALTIGFARRFAPYKRADLIMRDLELLKTLLKNADHPIQFLFAGKAHPADEAGKDLIQGIYKLTEKEPFSGRVLVLENYNIDMGRRLVQGVDLWLNNPRRPLEASGTSGQKVVLNGGLNCSILDGWWAEAFDGKNGFAIGDGRIHVDQETQDERDATDLYEVLQHEVIPLYYSRDLDDLPQEWIDRMKRAIRTLGWRFNADRMVMDYATHGYVPAAGGLSCRITPML